MVPRPPGIPPTSKKQLLPFAEDSLRGGTLATVVKLALAATFALQHQNSSSQFPCRWCVRCSKCSKLCDLTAIDTVQLYRYGASMFSNLLTWLLRHGKPCDFLWQSAYSGQFRRAETRSKHKMEEKINTITTHSHCTHKRRYEIQRIACWRICYSWILNIHHLFTGIHRSGVKESKRNTVNGILLCDHCYRE